MAQQTMDIGSAPNDGTGDPLRTAFDKANDNFTEVYEGLSGAHFPAGRFFLPLGPCVTTASGVAPGANSIRMFPGYVRRAITLTEIHARVTTLSAAGNFQLAIYAMDPATLMPTGAPLHSTASLSTGSATMVGETGLSVALAAGWYWFATIVDNGTAVLTSFSSANAWGVQLFGASTAALALTSGSVPVVGLSKAHTYGTWPTLTGSFAGDSLVEVITASIPLPVLKA